MTTKPRLEIGSHLLPGLAAVALFLVMAAVILAAPFGDPTGFPADANIVASIGNAMFNLDGGDVASEGFLVTFEIIDVVLVAALVGAVMLARREEEGSNVALLADGGRRVRDRFRGDAETETDAEPDVDGGDR